MMTSILKLGTRKSLLAWAQSNWVAREVERLNPGVLVELQGIETLGDKKVDIPLQSIQGKEFFVAEIDHALIAGEVDFTVHSMKDLSLDRPEVLTRAAVPKRENPRDVILFGPHALEHARSGRPLKIGTSSPRRIENIPGFLAKAFPKVGPAQVEGPKFEFLEIRGNVNTRLSRVHQLAYSEKYLDGVVLAFAGLIRLWRDEDGQKELEKLISGVRFMLLPLKECPAAPAQGALAVECRTNDEKVKTILNKLHDPQTAERVAMERQLLADWGGGCHQRFGATSISSNSLENLNLLFIRGVKSDGSRVDEISWDPVPKIGKSEAALARTWDGTFWRGRNVSKTNQVPDAIKQQAVFVAHSRAVHSDSVEALQTTRVWTSGTASWFRLAEQGIWVEGCAEGLGFSFLRSTLSEGVLGLPELLQWGVLTHGGGLEEWRSEGIQAIGTYQLNSFYGEDAQCALKAATHLFWSSGSQFDELKGWVQPGVRHGCGPGKTVARLKQAGLKPEVFPSVEEWRKWIKIVL